MKKAIHTIKVFNNTSSFEVYVVATSKEQAVQKAKKEYKCCSVYHTHIIRDVIL